MDEKTKSALLNYADTKQQIAALEEKLKELRPTIIEFLEAAGGKTFNLVGVGSFALSPRTNWKYSPEVQVLEEKLKKMKKIEVDTRTAMAESVTPILYFKVLREDGTGED